MCYRSEQADEDDERQQSVSEHGEFLGLSVVMNRMMAGSSLDWRLDTRRDPEHRGPSAGNDYTTLKRTVATAGG
jgi:hypothetical protein